MKVYVTKYAFTKGIECLRVAPTGIINGSRYVRPIAMRFDSLRLGVDAFESFEDAKLDAENRRTKRIASLKRQIAKLEQLRFEGDAA